jgi:hypothetical protein
MPYYCIQAGLLSNFVGLIEKLVEQPQVEDALGFWNLGPGADKSVDQSISSPSTTI